MAKDTGAKTADQTRDWSETLFLPKTDFPMRAGLPEQEPKLLARWDEIGLFDRLREAGEGRPKFVLHDGPPYANGSIHIGHALNKILKDLVAKSQRMLGRDSTYVPGWDCHGLPIEWKIEEEHRKKGQNKDEIPVNEFREECRAFAAKWLAVQREEFKRLGVVGDWDHPYSTMDFAAEATIARELMKFAETGQLYRGSKPVMWSVVEKTALAEAEVEYQDYTSDEVWVKFPVAPTLLAATPRGASAKEIRKINPPQPLLGASVLIWTTTPWTIPGNRAISFSKKIAYGLYEVLDVPDGIWAKPLDRFILADKLASGIMQTARVGEKYRRVRTVEVSELNELTCSHPLVTGYPFSIPLLDGDHVTDDTGTGFVHTAPGHGADDYNIWTVNKAALEARGVKTEIPFTVDADGVFTDEAPGFTGKRVLKENGDKGDANEAVIKALIDAGALIARGRLKHQYPHSWRSKKPVIFRNTPQWFIAMDKPLGSSPLPDGERPTHASRRSGAEDAAVGERVTAPGEGAKGSTGPAPSPPASAIVPGKARHRTTPASSRDGTDEATLHRIARDIEAASGAASPLPARAGGGGDEATLRQIALQAISETEWVPESGQNRIRGMVENRPDWVVSRQRAWGVPITVFRNSETDEVIPGPGFADNEELIRRIHDAFAEKGADVWFEDGAKERFLDSLVEDPAEWEQVRDVLDVWFDSGSTHAFTLEDPERFPALGGIRRARDGGVAPEARENHDRVMYLEGSDQHRGWFQSSLLESCGTRGRAPYDVVLTHGFILDEEKEKMAKSTGNALSPSQLMKTSGADILRLWVASADTTNDIRFGAGVLQGTSESYRKLRNTLRWMLGALAHFEDEHRVPFADLPDLERLMLHRLAELDSEIREAYGAYDFRKIVAALTHFMNTDLSAFYFDVRKDTLYCEPYSSEKRRAALTVIDQIFGCVTVWLAPILSFTAEEAWLLRYPSEDGSVHLQTFPEVPPHWRDGGLAEKWETVRRVRGVVTGALELERAAKRIGSSLEAAPEIYVADKGVREALEGIDLAEVAITSAAELKPKKPPNAAFTLPDIPGVGVVVKLAEGTKCARSWRITDDVGADPEFPELSLRDAAAVREFEARRGTIGD